MRKLFTLLSLFISIQLFAQKLIFDESFNNNDRAWATANDTSHILEINDGVYTFDHMREKGYWCSWQSVLIGQENNFRIKSSMYHKEGPSNMPFGLIWGGKNTSFMHAFLISDNGYFRVINYEKGTYNSHSGKWQKAESIRSGNWNVLEIKKQKDALQFYINENLVFTDSIYAFFGPKVGFVVYQRNAIQIENLQIYQDQPINVSNQTYNWSKKHLGKQINSSTPELNPVVSHDGQFLFFDRDEHPKNYGKRKKDDIWYAKWENKKWSEAVLMPPPINNQDHNGIISVSPDNMSLFVMNKYRTDSTKASSGFSLTHMTDTGWAYPTTVEVEDYYNTNKYTSACMGPNNKTIIMSLERSEGYGDLDLYVSFEHGDQYTIPLNLGPDINTYMSDGTPFLSADGKTLFFSSKGHYGYGSYDVFMSKRLDESWTRWSKPINLGPQINSPKWDAYFSITADGTAAFMTSNRSDSYGSIDIYSMIPPANLRPDLTLSISGRVINAKTGKFMLSNIYYYDMSTHKEIGKAKSSPQTGQFKLIVPQEHDYKVFAYMDGFFPTSEFIHLDSLNSSKEMQVNLMLHPIVRGETIPIHTSSNEMGKLARIMELYPDMRIQLNGSITDQKTIKDFLKDHGQVSYRYNQKGNITNELSFTIVHLGDKKQLHQETAVFDDEMDISDLQIGQKFKVPSIYFDADSIQFQHISTQSLNDVIQFLEQYTSVQIEIGGHTNGLPNHTYCDNLSYLRANAVRKYMISKGIDPNRVVAKGYGKRQNIASNETEKGRLKNQRVEIKILHI